MMQLACFEGWSRFWAGMGSIIKFKYQSTMSDEEILPCVMCHQHHEQMLMLTCMHDPCINCAAVHYCSSQPSSSNVYSLSLVRSTPALSAVTTPNSTPPAQWNCRESTM